MGMPERPPKRKRTFREYFLEASQVQHLAWCYVIVSLADLLMTYLLLRTGPHFYESNVIAHWFFERWNILGMTLFKFAVVGAVIAVSEIIERHRPGVGRLILVIGCGAAGYALVIGFRLYVGLDH